MIRLRTLGALGLEKGGGEVRSVLAQPKRLALLAYLAIARPRGFHRRDTLLGLFWPELDESRARAALSQALYYLRQALGSRAVKGRGKDEVAVDRERVWCDAAVLDEALGSDQVEDLRAALDLYRGDLLAGFFLSDAPEFERWLEDERARLRGRAAEAAWTLCEHAEAEGRIAEAAEWGRRSLALSAYDEALLRRLIELHDRAGDRAGAVQVYEEVADRLEREYDLEPAPETQALIAEVRVRIEPRIDRMGEGGPTDRPRPSGTDLPTRPLSVGAEGSTQERGAGTTPAGTGTTPGRSDLASGSGRRRLVWAAGVAVAAAISIALVLLTRPASSPTAADAASPALDPTRVAVLPLENSSSDGSDDYIADGLTTELISRLARLRDLRVIPWTSVRRYRDSHRTAAEIGRELNVGTLIEGRTLATGDSVRIVVSMLRAETEELAWSRAYTADFTQLLETHLRIAEDVALELRVGNRTSPDAERGPRGTDDATAAREYLRGRAALARDSWEAALEARDHFLRATKVDSMFAEAWGGLATAYTVLARGGVIGGPGPWELARNAAGRALALDDELPEAHAALGIIHSMADWDGALAERHFRAAIDLDPSYARAHLAYAAHLRNQGQFEEALASIRVARQLEPREARTVAQQAQTLYLMRRLDETINLVDGYLSSMAPADVEELRAAPATGLASAHFSLQFSRALAQLAKGELDAALVSLDRADPAAANPDAMCLRGYAYARLGQTDLARALLREMDGQVEQGIFPSSAFHKAVIHIGLGEHRRAIALLETAARERTRLIGLLKVEPMLDPLRPYPRFQALLQRVGFAEASDDSTRSLPGFP